MQRRLLAALRHAPSILRMSVHRSHRKSPCSGKTDANDPEQTAGPTQANAEIDEMMNSRRGSDRQFVF